MIRVKDPSLHDQMAKIQSTYPSKGNRDFFTRILKFFVIKIVTTWPIMALIYRGFEVFGRYFEETIADPV